MKRDTVQLHTRQQRDQSTDHPSFAEIWQNSSVLPTDHPQTTWSDNTIRFAPAGLSIGEVDLSGCLVYCLFDRYGEPSGLYFYDHADRRRQVVVGDGCWRPVHTIPVAATVWITEQIETAASIASIGFYAMAYIRPDRLQAQIEAWQGIGYALKLVVPPHQRNLPRKFVDIVVPVMDLPCWGDNPDQIKAMLGHGEISAQYAQQHRTEWPQPIAYLPDQPAALPYPLHMFPPIAREAAQAIAEYAQAHEALAAQCVLGVLTYIGQDAVNAPALNNPHGMPASLFILTEGESGCRKTGCQELSDVVLMEVERHKMEAYQTELSAYQALPRKEKEQTTPPTNPKTLFKDTTIEPVIGALLHNSVHSVMLSTDEAGQFFGGYSLQSDSSHAVMGTLTSLYSRGIVERSRSASNLDASGIGFDKRLAINLLGQREVLQPALTNPVMRGQGLLPRFLLASVPSLAGTRLLDYDAPKQQAYDDPRLQRYWARCRELIGYRADGLPEALGQSPESRYIMPMHRSAEKLWYAFYNQIEELQAAGQAFDQLRPFAGRAGENARRVATILAYFEQLPEITEEIMAAACEIVRYSLYEWKRYTDSPDSDVYLTAVSRLERWMIEKAVSGQIERSLVLKDQPLRLIRKGGSRQLDNALALLEDHHRIQQTKQGRKSVILINPQLL